MGKEALPSLCPPGIWFRFNLIPLVLCLWWFFIFVCVIMKHEIIVLLWALWGDSIALYLVPNAYDSWALSIRSFCVLEKTPLLLRFSSIPLNPWGPSLKYFGDVFLKSSSSSPQNLSSFGLELIVQSSRFPKVAGWKAFLDSVLPSTGWTNALKLYASVQPVSIPCVFFSSFFSLFASALLLACS